MCVCVLVVVCTGGTPVVMRNRGALCWWSSKEGVALISCRQRVPEHLVAYFLGDVIVAWGVVSAAHLTSLCELCRLSGREVFAGPCPLRAAVAAMFNGILIGCYDSLRLSVPSLFVKAWSCYIGMSRGHLPLVPLPHTLCM